MQGVEAPCMKVGQEIGPSKIGMPGIGGRPAGRLPGGKGGSLGSGSWCRKS